MQTSDQIIRTSWPDNLNRISFNGIKRSELWFLKEIIEAGHGMFTDYHDKFGYHECQFNIESDQYLLKYSDRIENHHYANVPDHGCQIFYVRVIGR